MRRNTVRLALGIWLGVAITGLGWAGEIEFEFDPGAFSDPTSLTNDFWGLRLGGPSSAVFFSESDDGCEVSESVVVGTTGPGFFNEPYDIDTVIIHDREWVDEECTGDYMLVEDTFDWYAEDDAANVWYLGEDTTAWEEDDACLSSAGSWKAGDGAMPGVVMPADPRPGTWYQQEYFEDEAEDRAKILRLNADVSIEFGEYAGCLMTKEYTPLSPGDIEHKFYCRLGEGGFGLMLVNELKGKTRRVEYIGSGLPAGDFPGGFPDPGAPACEE
jgi:hypothetical protein